MALAGPAAPLFFLRNTPDRCFLLHLLRSADKREALTALQQKVNQFGESISAPRKPTAARLFLAQTAASGSAGFSSPEIMPLPILENKVGLERPQELSHVRKREIGCEHQTAACDQNLQAMQVLTKLKEA